MDGKTYTVRQLAEEMNVSKTTVKRLMTEFDSEYVMKHSIMNKNRMIIDAELRKAIRNKANLNETEPEQNETTQQNETDNTEISEKMLQQFETKLQYFEISQHSNETLLKHLEKENEYLKSQIENKDKELQNLKQEYISQLTVKDNQIQELQKLLDQEQQLHKQTKDQYQLLLVDKEEPPEHLQEQLTTKDNMLTEQAEQIEKLKAELTEEKSKGFFKRLFKK